MDAYQDMMTRANHILLNSPSSSQDKTPLLLNLFLCCEFGWSDHVFTLAKSSLDLDAQNQNGETALLVACRQGHEMVTRYLLECGASVNKELRRDGSSPLLVACKAGHLNIVHLLLAWHAEVDQPNKDLVTPLIAAVKYGHEDVVKVLLSAEVRVNQRTLHGESALSIASDKQLDDVVIRIQNMIDQSISR